MRKVFLRGISTVCAIAMTAALFAGCGSNSESSQSSSTAARESTAATATSAAAAEPAKLTFITVDVGRINKENNPVVQEIERRTNTKLEMSVVPGGEFSNKFSILVASDSVPDICRIGNYDFFQYIPQGAFMEISKLIDQYGENVKKNVPQEAWDKVKTNGKAYAIPSYNWSGKYNFVIRQDWLDNLGIKAPTNLDELSGMLNKFTYNDPDKNGKNDTYGLTSDTESTAIPNTFMVIFGAFGIMPGQYFEKDGKVYSPMVTQEYKDAIAYITKLYKDDKVVDPDLLILKRDQAVQNLVQGRAGSLTCWWATPEQVLMDQMKMNMVNPNAKWTISPAIKGKNGESGFKSAGTVSATASIGAKCKNPEAAFKFLDYLVSDEGAKLAMYGIKDVHYTEKDGKFEKRTEEGTKAMNEKWLDPLALVVSRIDIQAELYKVNNPTYWPYMTAARDSHIYQNLFEGITTSESQKLTADLTKFETEWFIKFITGKEPLSKFDEYAKQWKEKGGKEIMDSFIKEYNARYGKNLTAGN